MSLTKSWYTIEEAADKFGLTTQQLQEWTDIGLIRTLEYNDMTIHLNGEDIERELDFTPTP